MAEMVQFSDLHKIGEIFSVGEDADVPPGSNGRLKAHRPAEQRRAN